MPSFGGGYSPLDGFRINLAAYSAALAEIDRAADRAVMWGVREAARRTGAAARARAPVYTGAYQASIKSSKQLATVGAGVHRVRVGPRGPRVHLYAGKVERRDSPMQGAYAQVRGEVGAIFERGMRTALARYR